MKQVSGIFFIVFALLAGLFSSANAQNTSNKGTDFWVGYGNHVRDWQIGVGASAQKMSLYITSDVNTNVTVEVQGLIQTKAVTANSITIIDIPDGARLTREGKFASGIHVTAEKPVVVYSHIFASNVSGATLVLPTSTLGKNYYSINFTQISNEGNSYSYFFVVAVEDGTQVEIIPSAKTLGAASPAGPSWAAGSPNIITLNKGEIYQVLSSSDLTGSVIKSRSTNSEPCKRIAVFSGSGKIAIGCGNSGSGSADNLYQQVYPTVAWGKKFITAPLKSRNYDIFRIMKSDITANVTLNGSPIPATSFINNFYYEFTSQQVNVIESDKPIQVAQYAVTQNKSINCVNIPEPAGDPEMIFLNPLEQNIEKITLYSTKEYNIIAHFINVIIETSAAGSFVLDGVSIPGSFLPVPGQPDYSYAQLSVSQGVHNLAAAKGFNAIAYGFGAAESYGYSAGTNVKSLAIEARSKLNNQVLDNGCINEPLNFSIKLRYKTDRLVWDLGNGASPKEILNPVPLDQNPPNGLYEYQFSDPVIYSSAKDYLVQVTANNPSSDGCGSTEILELLFSVFNPPVPQFESTTGICQGSAVQFTDKSDGGGRDIKSWLWDFGDGSNDTTEKVKQNPSHIYMNGGTFAVTLTVTNESNCSPVVSAVQKVIIIKKPIANFNFSTPDCTTKAITFTDSSTSAEGTIVKWTWDFGDSIIAEERTSAAAFTHTYTDAGTYNISLKVLTDKGCESTAMLRSVVVHPLPRINFIVPEVCITDKFALFTDSTTISDNSGQLVYLWNFGDSLAATSSNPNTSDLKDPKHKYTSAGNYQVTLTVKSKDGCEATLSKSFQVNGATPKADFTVVNRDQLCSNREVVLINTSSVDFGTIGRLEWYFDYGNAQTVMVVDENPFPGKQYRFQYPVFLSPASKNIVVRLLAYSGGSCSNEYRETITIIAAPKVSFNQLDNVCLEAPAFRIIQAKEINNQPGTGNFYGNGVSLSGMFDPVKAGLGSHTIKYVFTASNGCADSLSQDIMVMPTPTVYAGRDTFMLEGTEIKLNAVASGRNLVYKWMPAVGLSRDDIPDPVASPTNNVTYTLSVTSDQGCVAIDNIFIKVLKIPEVPNTFTPNGDGVNDLWNIRYLNDYLAPYVQVFNRYGAIIYSTTGYSSPWDGKINGTDAPVGTYYYIVQPRMGRKAISGSVTILR